MLPIELIEIILGFIKISRDYKLILNARAVSRFWYRHFPEILEYDASKNHIIRKHIFKENCFKTYRMPLLSIERFIEFKKYGGYKYIKYDNLGKVVEVIKTPSLFSVERKHIYETNSYYNNKKIKFIQEKKYEINNNNQKSELKEANPMNMYILQKEHEFEYGKKYNLYNLNHLNFYPNYPNCSLM